MKSKGKTKTKKSDSPAEFISPLEQYIKEKCEKCSCYIGNQQLTEITAPFTCSLGSPNGIDRMFLCMCAANNNDILAVDPAQILNDAKETLKALDVDGGLKELFPKMFSPENTFYSETVSEASQNAVKEEF